MDRWAAAYVANHVAANRLSGAWWLLATTGMRRAEVLGLRWSDVDLVVCKLDGTSLHPKNLS